MKVSKKYYVLVLFLFSVCFGFAQTNDSLSIEEQQRREKNIQAGNPFKKFGYTPKIHTLSKGKYLEFHDLDSIVKIGSFSYHVKRKSITGYIIEETGYSEATLRPEIVSRWFSPDPLSDEFPSWSPYNFVNNNPIILSDPTGLYPEYFATKVVNKDNPNQVIDINDGYDFTFYVNQNEFNEIAKNGSIEGTSTHKRWFWEAVAYEMKKPNSNHWMDSFLQFLVYDGVGDAIDNTVNEQYVSAALAIFLSKLKPGKEGYKLVKKLTKYGKKGKMPTPDLNPEQFTPKNGKWVHNDTGAIFDKSRTSHGNPGNTGNQWKAWSKGTKDYGSIGKTSGTRVTIDYDGNVIGN